VSPDGVLLATSCQRTRQVRLWERASGRLVAELPVEDGTLKMEFAPDGRRLAVTSELRSRVYELAGRGVQTFAAAGPETILACARHPAGGSLACLSRCAGHARARDLAVWPLAPAGPARPAQVVWTGMDDWTAPGLAFHPGSQALAHQAGAAIFVR